MDEPGVARVELLRMVLVCGMVCGMEFCASAGFTYIPPLLLKAHLSEVHMSFILVLGPVLGVIFVPVLARLSDRCRSKHGRRTPFILGLSCAVIFSLVVIPYAGLLAHHHHSALLIIGVVTLDFASQACFNPIEALLSDMFETPASRDRCFMVYSAMLSVGGCVGYLITAMDWMQFEVGHWFGKQERVVFMLLTLLFVLTLITSLSVARDRPFTATNRRKQSNTNDVSNISATDQIHYLLMPRSYISVPLKFIWKSIEDIVFAPMALRRLFLCHFFCYTALFCHNLFYTDFMGSYVFGGDPNAPDGSSEQMLYDSGVRAGSWGLFCHCVISAMYSAYLERVSASIGLYATFVVGVGSFTCSMFLSALLMDIYVLTLLTAATGLFLATMSTLPFTLVTRYRECSDIYLSDGRRSRGAGTDMAVLDTAYFLSQIIMPSCMGYLVQVTGTLATYLVTAGVFGALGLVSVRYIIFDKTQMAALSQPAKNETRNILPQQSDMV